MLECATKDLALGLMQWHRWLRVTSDPDKEDTTKEGGGANIKFVAWRQGGTLISFLK
jgi:hypothetical protein